MEQIDPSRIKQIAYDLASLLEATHKRNFVPDLKIGKEPRIKVLRGFRGLGKTTSLLQIMKENPNAIYFSLDHPYTQNFDLYDLSRLLIKNAGFTILLIDEIQYSKNWKNRTKALYDEFPHVSLVLSGSAPLAFEPERRYEILDIEPLSISEFLKLKGVPISPTESWRSSDASILFLSSNNSLYAEYEKYLNEGAAFPIYIKYGESTLSAIYSSIRKSIREDAPFFSRTDAEMIRAMEKLLNFLATASLGDFSINSISKTLEINKNKGYEIVALLESMRILRLVRPYGRGAKLVRGEPKLMFYHPNLRSAVCKVLGVKPNIGALREELAVFSLFRRGWNVNTIKGMKHNPDYVIEKAGERIIVEIGGPSKNAKQLLGFREKKLILTDYQLITLAV